MTRKRFIKLCMSKGVSRNEANKKAVCCRNAGLTYSEYWSRIRWGLGITAGTKKLAKNLCKLGTAMLLAASGIALLRKELKYYKENERKRVENEVFKGDSGRIFTKLSKERNYGS